MVNGVKTGTIVGAGKASWAAGSTTSLTAFSMSGNKVVYSVLPVSTPIKGPGGQSIGCNFSFEIKNSGGGKLPNGTYDVWAILSITAPGQSKTAMSIVQAAVTNGLGTELVLATITCQPVGGTGKASATGSYTITTPATMNQDGSWTNGWSLSNILVSFVPNGGGSVLAVTPTITPDPNIPGKGTWSVPNTTMPAGTYNVLATIAVTGQAQNKGTDQQDGSGWQNITVQ